jgi:DNA-binding response OmpR family regulator
VDATRALLRCWPDLEVVFLSMFDDRQLVLRALGAGAKGYVLKRAGIGELMQSIRLLTPVATGPGYPTVAGFLFFQRRPSLLETRWKLRLTNVQYLAIDSAGRRMLY